MSVPRLTIVLVVFSAALATAASPEYGAIRAARPDGRVVTIKQLSLQRDAYQLTFHSGAMHFIAPVSGRTWAAVFVGDGTFQLEPATTAERRQLGLVTGEKDFQNLTDTFDTMVLFFTDGTAREIEQHAEVRQETPDPRAGAAWDEHLKLQKTKYQVNLHLRILRDLIDRRGDDGVFIAAVDGKKYAPALLTVDPLGIGNLAARFGDLGGEETAYLSYDDSNGGLWYLSTKKSAAVNGRGKALPAVADAQHYSIDTHIKSNSEIEGRTKVQIKSLRDGVRVIPLHLLPKLRIHDVAVSRNGQAIPAGFVQEEVELGRFARLFREEVADADAAVILPEPLKQNEIVELDITYSGREVLQGSGPESYSVRARESWYPNLGTFSDLATYDLTFRYPKRNSLISVGQRVSETEQSGQKVAVWKTEKPMRIAGFNYGRFEKLSRKDETGLLIDVYTSRDRVRMANDTMADAMNTARVATIYFGQAPFSPVSVTQQAEWSFGQSWPSLIFLPELAVTTSTERVAIFEGAGPALYQINEFVKMVGWHELAHQWWGHQVGFETYRDAWLSEGFAEFTASLVLHFTESPRRYVDYWSRRRDQILAKHGNVANFDAGPISQGFRLSTRRSPEAAQAMVYSKGAYVLHMLRMLMRDPQAKDQDEKFAAMMRDYVTRYAGKNPSTADFQKVVEAHMNPRMDLAGNGKMDYFFQQWVHGTEIPKFKSTLKIEPSGQGRYRLAGTIWQEDVSGDFHSLVPVYLDFGGDNISRVGTLILHGTTPGDLDVEMALPKAPKRVVLNAMNDVLARP